ncbi:MAG: hypothetical protein GPJ54_01070 [Candidatus Heimdallarchaeota archaeon]|nr:hypothetical protein [Candidatus Heimdallarchaeota archaeon]
MADVDYVRTTNITNRTAKHFKLTHHLKSSLFEVRELGFAKPKTMKVFYKNYTRGSSNLSNRNAVSSDQTVDKNHGNTSLLISSFEPSKEGEDDRNTDSQESRILLASEEVVATHDSVCGT